MSKGITQSLQIMENVIDLLNQLIENWVNLHLIFNAIQHMALIFVIAFLFSKSSIFNLLVKNILRKRDWFLLYAMFSVISVLGSILAIDVLINVDLNSWTQIDSRSIGAFLAGLLGGPLLGTAVGFTAGCYRFLLGGPTAFAGFAGTTLTGLIAGLVYLLTLKNNQDKRFNWKIAVMTVCAAELMMKGLVLLTVQPLSEAVALIQITLLPNIIANSVGAALFVSVLRDYERFGSASSNQAFRMAGRMTKTLQDGLNPQSANVITQLVRKETKVAAVAISDLNSLLAYNGIASNHHQVDDENIMKLVKQVIKQKRNLYFDGHDNKFNCSLKKDCPLNSVLIAPLIIENQVQGTLLLFETKQHFFPKMDKVLGRDVARFVSRQLQTTQHQQLLHDSRYEALKAQVKPHFLANALNTIAVIMRRDQQQARDLLSNLAAFMRRTIDKQQLTTVSKELENLEDYLAIETARFGDKLTFSVNMQPAVADVIIPNFIVQPIVENAIKHGTSKMLIDSLITIDAYIENSQSVKIEIRDNAGLFINAEKIDVKIQKTAGIGLYNVSKRIEYLCDDKESLDNYGLEVDCMTGNKTVVTLKIPYRII